MEDDLAVLGIATTSQRGVLTVHRVIVRLSRDDSLDVERLEAWKGSPRDEARSMTDLVDALSNTLDRRRAGAPNGLAVKRTESPRGRPSNPYDQKIRAEAAAMIAASSQGRRYFQYRTNQLNAGKALHDQAGAPDSESLTKEEAEAVGAACSALAELRDERDRDG